MNRAWIYVVITSVLELVWLYGFKEASLWWHWALIIGLIICDLQLLAKACEGLPTGTVYAIFAATGTIGTVLMDYYFFDVEITHEMLLFMGVILFGVIGLNLSDVNTRAEADHSEKNRGKATRKHHAPSHYQTHAEGGNQ